MSIQIHQCTSKLVHKERFGQWWCCDSIKGADGDAVVRYLKKDGTWAENTDYFDSREQIEEALKLGHKPDFTVSKEEQWGRDMMREDTRKMFEEELDDRFDDRFEVTYPQSNEYDW